LSETSREDSKESEKMTKKIYVLGGGTIQHIRPHLALCAPAYGKAARHIAKSLQYHPIVADGNYQLMLRLTRMANPANPYLCIGETNEDVGEQLEKIATDPDTKMIFMSVALCDYVPTLGEMKDGKLVWNRPVGKNHARLKSSEQQYLRLHQAHKIIGEIRKKRKDIFLVGFKTTAGVSEEEQYEAGLTLLKKNSCNLVLANDIQTGLNMIVCPELAAYSVSHDREQVLDDLVDMALSRSTNTFSRTRVSMQEPPTRAPKPLMSWEQGEVPETLRKVVDWCVENGAYKPFNNVTVGHFGFRPGHPDQLWSSRRKQNFNDISARDLVFVKFTESGVEAGGAKPSAGARSQYTVLSKFSDLDCIVHFHCPMKPGSSVPVRSQRAFECGSHECGKNTAEGMVRVNDNLAAVMLDKHGPNVVFSSKADPKMVIDFIEANFDLSKSTR
jgi:hypothetical protein